MFASKDFLYSLGVITLFIFAIYFAYAVLKGSGEGVQQLLGSANVIEGMTERQKEKKYDKFIKNIDKEIEKKKKTLNDIDKENGDLTDDYKDKLQELADVEKEIFIKMFITNLGNATVRDGIIGNDVTNALAAAGQTAPLGCLSYISDKTATLLD